MLFNSRVLKGFLFGLFSVKNTFLPNGEEDMAGIECPKRPRNRAKEKQVRNLDWGSSAQAREAFYRKS